MHARLALPAEQKRWYKWTRMFNRTIKYDKENWNQFITINLLWQISLSIFKFQMCKNIASFNCALHWDFECVYSAISNQISIKFVNKKFGVLRISMLNRFRLFLLQYFRRRLSWVDVKIILSIQLHMKRVAFFQSVFDLADFNSQQMHTSLNEPENK